MSKYNETFKDKFQRTSCKIKNKVRNFSLNAKEGVKKFWRENKDIIIVVAPIAGSILVKQMTHTNKKKQLKSEQDLKDLYIYDRKKGHYWPLQRKPKASEWIEIDARRENGEELYNILASMDLLR